MKKIVYLLLLGASITTGAQTKTIVTVNGEKVSYPPATTNTLGVSGNTLTSIVNGIPAAIDLSSIGKEPFNVANTSTQATGNTQNIYQMGNVGIGTTSPSAKLEINSGGTSANQISAIKIVDGSQGNNRVLTSDPNGYASWQSISGSWAAYAWDANKLRGDGSQQPVLFSTTNTRINGQGGSFNGGTGRVYVPKAGLYRIIIYLDFPFGTPSSNGCGDMELRGYNSDGSFASLYNCDNVGSRDGVRKNGYMQAIASLPAGGSIGVKSTGEVTEGVISIELVN